MTFKGIRLYNKSAINGAKPVSTNLYQPTIQPTYLSVAPPPPPSPTTTNLAITELQVQSLDRVRQASPGTSETG